MKEEEQLLKVKDQRKKDQRSAITEGHRIISPENQNFYNISITLHGFLMIFFLVMPGLFGGFGNYFVPIFQGSPVH